MPSILFIYKKKNFVEAKNEESIKSTRDKVKEQLVQEGTFEPGHLRRVEGKKG